MISRTTLAAAIAAAVFSSGAFSQDGTPPASRAAVKAETRAAEKAGKLTPAGEGIPVDPSQYSRSNKTRADRKAETRLARKDGELMPAGDASDLKEEKEESAAWHSTKTRAQRKAQVRADAKAGRLIPAGEGPTAPKQ